MATAKQKAWRAKFARLYGGGRKKRSTVRTVYRTVRRKVTSMARRGRRSYRRSGGLGSLTPLLYGAGAAFILPKVGVNVSPLMLGAGGGFLARKNVMGAAMGAAGAYLAGMFLNGSATSSTTNPNGAW